ncbi:ABC transporter permease [Clostridium scatologenes]|uniref:Uncharacterized protein n=1 Tax=Clostridium scatologenes TaxID=1548 RepID=A0A0E3JXL6_CLOSL|nr:ABC transporter permease [Clostridium scatologenes]AKA68287.1 hypothetical protein CSCA_1162 [Clostridium scatologenes]
MHKLLKMSWLNVKNTAYSKEFLLGIIAAFAYSMLWICFVQPPLYGLEGYGFEFGRFLYVMILYAAVSILRNDIKSNCIKTVFTGVFSRTEIMISKSIGLIIWGIIFSIIVEVNNILASIILYKKIGINGFLAFNHLQLFITYIVIAFSMGALMLLIISIIFNESKFILFFIVILSLVNFYSSFISVAIGNHPELINKFSTYMKTPFYNTIALMQGYFTMQSVLINVIWAVIFCALATLIINKREIN